MPQKQRARRRGKPVLPPQQSNSKTPIIYIVVVSVMVFSLVLAGLSTIDFSGILGGDAEPTPDYEIDQIAVQETVVAQNPEDSEAHTLLASMLANSGRMQEAIPVFEEAIRLDPENATIRIDFARSLQSNGMEADAEAQFQRALELEPENHTAHYYLGRLYMDWDPSRQEEAIPHLERVIDIAPNSFLAEQASGVLDSLGPATRSEYEVTPIASTPTPQ